MWLLKLYNTINLLPKSNNNNHLHLNNYIAHSNNIDTSFIITDYKKSITCNSLNLVSFKTFISLGSTTTSGLLKVHPSNNQLFLKNSSGSGSFTSLRHLFNVYNQFNSLLFNVLYFNIKLLSFGNSVFRQEISSINWGYISYYYSMFKLNNLSIFYQPNKLNDKFPKIFKFFRMNGFHTSVVYDPNYHKRTIYYLHRLSFFSIGVTPANMPRYILNVSLPTLNDTLLAHLFMMRLFIKTRKQVDSTLFKASHSLWENKA